MDVGDKKMRIVMPQDAPACRYYRTCGGDSCQRCEVAERIDLRASRMFQRSAQDRRKLRTYGNV